MERSLGHGCPSAHLTAKRAMHVIKFYASTIVHDNDEATRPARFEVMCRYIVRLVEALRLTLPGREGGISSKEVQALKQEVASLKAAAAKAHADAADAKEQMVAVQNELQKELADVKLQLAHLLSRPSNPAAPGPAVTSKPAPTQGVTTPLHEAAKTGNLVSVRELVEGRLVSMESKAVADYPWCSRTPLILAAEAGHANIVLYLIGAGADVNAKGKDGDTALMRATGDVAITHALLAAGADVNVKDNNGCTALLLTIWRDGANAGVVSALLAAGAAVNAANKDGETTLMRATLVGDEASVRALIEAGADVNAKDNNDITALSVASGFGRESMCALLRAAGARA
jgi:ankyrin repeat protein